MKVCNKCKELKPLDSFYKSPRLKSGYEGLCKKCKQSRKYYHEITERSEDNSQGFCVLCKRRVILTASGLCSLSRRNMFSSDGVDRRDWTKTEMTKDHNLKSTFRIGLARYREILEEQNHSCASCGRPTSDFSKEFAVDHDHNCCPGRKSCGKCVRGLLCANCNVGIGFFDDDVERMKLAIAYLESWEV